MKNTIETIAKGFSTNIKVEELADKVYNIISKDNSNVAVLNDKYLMADEVSYQFRRKTTSGRYKLFKEFKGIA